MSLSITFELSDDDLRHFELIMREARKTIAGTPPEDIVAEAEALLQEMDESCGAQTFISERIQQLRLMIRMLSDLEWRLPHQEATHVLNALAYFSDPEDLIPDGLPGFGYLDDAIMIELVARELKHEIDAYQDFCEFRDRARAVTGSNTPVSREDWLSDRRLAPREQARRNGENKQ